MGVRHLARQRAMQLLYALEYAERDASFEDVERRFLICEPSHRRGWGPFARSLTRTAREHRLELDEAIRPALRHWTLERLPAIDRLCLRLALTELRHFPEIPLRVTIDEYVELVRRFSGDDSPPYVNAVLDRLAREHPEKDFQIERPGRGPGQPRAVAPHSPPEQDPQ